MRVTTQYGHGLHIPSGPSPRVQAQQITLPKKEERILRNKLGKLLLYAAGSFKISARIDGNRMDSEKNCNHVFQDSQYSFIVQEVPSNVFTVLLPL